MTEPDPNQPHHTADDLLPARLRKHVPILAVVGITVAAVGYLTGIREPRRPEIPPPPVSVPNAGLPDAVDYSRLTTVQLRPAAGTTGTLAQLKFDKPGIFDAVTRTEEMKLAALADRAKNRAYDGAPPTIPHPVEAQSAAACLACHRDGIKVGDRVASAMSHAHFSNCTQCHVAQSTAPFANEFAGLYRAGPGTRASPGAPPTIPHSTWMRENCTSCHGLVTRPGIRTTHPWLTNCTQCHAPSATTDQRDFAGRAP